MGKSKIKGSVGVTLAVCAALITTACGSQATTSNTANGNQNQKVYKIGFANLTETIPYCVDVEKSIQAEAKKEGMQVVVADNKLDGATALTNAQSFIAQHIDLAIEFQSDQKFGPVIDDAFKKAGIPVIAIDIPMQGATYFGANNKEAGTIGGKAVAEAAKKAWSSIDKVVVLAAQETGQVSADRANGGIEGIKSVFSDLSDANIITLDSQGAIDVANRVVTDALTSIPNAHHIVFICQNDEAAKGAIVALTAAHRLDQALIVGQGADSTGQDLVQQYGDAPFVGSVGYFPDKYGSYLIPLAKQILQTHQQPSEKFMDHLLVNKENISKYYPSTN